MNVLYAVVGILTLGALELCIILGGIGLIDIIASTSKSHLSHSGKLYKLRKPEVWRGEKDLEKPRPKETFLYFVNGELKGAFDLVE